MDAIKELKWFLGALAIVWMIWFLTGGPARYESEHQDKPFLKAPIPLDTGEVYGPTGYVNINAPAGWTSITVKNYFGIALPVGWYRKDEQTVTGGGYRGTITDGHTQLFFDYGPQAISPITEGDSSYTASHETIDKEDALVIKPKTSSATVTGVYFAKTPSGAHFSLVGFNLSTTERTTALSIARTIDFVGN